MIMSIKIGATLESFSKLKNDIFTEPYHIGENIRRQNKSIQLRAIPGIDEGLNRVIDSG